MDFGKWKLSEDQACWVCSVCGAAALNDYAGRSTPSNFCPHCGTSMMFIHVDLAEEADFNG